MATLLYHKFTTSKNKLLHQHCMTDVGKTPLMRPTLHNIAKISSPEQWWLFSVRVHYTPECMVVKAIPDQSRDRTCTAYVLKHRVHVSIAEAETTLQATITYQNNTNRLVTLCYHANH